MRTFLSLSLLLTSMIVAAQTSTSHISGNAAPSWLESTLYGGGKINAVVAVVAVIILGIGVWMWRMDRRLTKMEHTARSKHL